MASLIKVKEPLIRAWLAMMAAAVAMMMPTIRNESGITAKKGFRRGSAVGFNAIKAASFINPALANNFPFWANKYAP